LFRLKQPEEEIEETPELTGTSPLNPAQLYDLLLGYGYGLLGYNGGRESQSVPELVETSYDIGGDTGFIGGTGVGRAPTGDNEITNKNHTSIVTTCYSPVLSSVQQESTAKGGSSNGGGQTFSGTASLNETSSSSFFDSTYFPPYSIILAITIAVGK